MMCTWCTTHFHHLDYCERILYQKRTAFTREFPIVRNFCTAHLLLVAFFPELHCVHLIAIAKDACTTSILPIKVYYIEIADFCLFHSHRKIKPLNMIIENGIEIICTNTIKHMCIRDALRFD